VLVAFLFSCDKQTKINECKIIAESALGNAEGFKLRNAEYNSREGLKLAVPDEFKFSTHVVSISYDKDQIEYKGTTCYYNSAGSLMGSESH
jgi:hypothetical protein